MATSGITQTPMTARQMIKEAFMLLNVVPASQAVNGDDEEAGRVMLNCMLSDWMMDGVTPWRKQIDVLQLVEGQADYTLTRPVEIIEARYLPNGGNAGDPCTCGVEIDQVEWDEFQDIACKASQGQPSQFRYNRGVNDATLSVWPVPMAFSGIYFDTLDPNAAGTSFFTDPADVVGSFVVGATATSLYKSTVDGSYWSFDGVAYVASSFDPGQLFYSFHRAPEMVTDVIQDVDIPQEWRLTVKYNLAALLADSFGGDTKIVDRIIMRAESFYTKAMMYEREGSVFMFPDESYS